METSENINELAAALSKAQGKITGALKDSSNPFFKSKYADLASCWEACRQHLSDNGLAVIQTVSGDEARELVLVTTMLTHSSGQWVRDTMSLMPKDTGPQALGSCITYGRRYALAAIVGLAQIDDDAEAATARGAAASTAPDKDFTPAEHGRTREYADRLRKALVEGNDGLILELHNELNPEAMFYVLVSTKLSAAERRSLKDSIKAHANGHRPQA